MSHLLPPAGLSPERAQLPGPIERRDEESSSIINTITAIAVSIIFTVLCYMTLPAQGATPVVAVVWILAYYLSFGSDCLDENPDERGPRVGSIPARDRTHHHASPRRLGRDRDQFVSPQKGLPAHQRPRSRESVPLQFSAGAETRPPNYEAHRRRVKERQKQRRRDTNPVHQHSSHLGVESPAVAVMSQAEKAFHKMKDRFIGSDSNSDEELEPGRDSQFKVGSARRTEEPGWGSQFKAGSRRRTDS